VESRPRQRPKASAGVPALDLQLLGGVFVRRDGAALALPASRKVRALLGYLALAPRPVGRAQLCELLWDVPNDPRGELRWSLSKLRPLLDEPGRARIVTDGDTVALDLSDCTVDAVAIERAMQHGIESIAPDGLRALADRFAGDFLAGVEIDRQPLYENWLIAQRRRFRACQVAVLEHLVHGADPASEDVFAALETWLQLAPLDARAHEAMLGALARHGRPREGEEHLAAATRLFEAEGLDVAPLRFAWRNARVQRQPEPAAGTIVLPSTSPLAPADAAMPARRASIAVMPFVDRTGAEDGRGGGLAESLAHDVITRLAKLRVMFVIAHGSVFALKDRNVGPEEAGRMLNVDYVASGWLLRRGAQLILTGELMETRSARIIWTENFEYPLRDALTALDDIGNHLVAAIAHEVEVAERNRAILKPPSSLDAWEAYHRGLWHMYRFNATDNELANEFLRRAVTLDPTFARAYAALSFTHFQNAFLHKMADRKRETDLAFDIAGQSLLVDELDPASHWAMGRAQWLRGRPQDALVSLERSVELSPNFALGHYTLAFVHCQAGGPNSAIKSADHSRHLSPFGPLLFAMFSSRALGHLRLGQLDDAADWAMKGAARPNSHRHTMAIAAHCLALAGRLDEARAMAQKIRAAHPDFRPDEMLSVFQFSPEGVEMLRRSMKLLE